MHDPATELPRITLLRLSEKWLEGVWSPRVSVALNRANGGVFFCSCEPLVGSRLEARFDLSDSLFHALR